MITFCGYVGALMLALCAVPQAWLSISQGHSNGLSWAFLSLWGGGELLTLAYVWPKKHWPLIINYVLNIGLIGVMIWYK